jgi:predicted phage tail protein
VPAPVTTSPSRQPTTSPTRRSVAAAPATGATLANTGTDAVLIAGTGTAMTVGGVMLLIVTRRRPRPTS